MSEQEINLLNFGYNELGEYVDLVEEERKKNDISKNELESWVNNNDDPLIKIAYDSYYSSRWELDTCKGIQEKLIEIAKTKCYHYGNMGKGLYIFSINNEGRYFIIFENENHYLTHEASGWKLEYGSYGNIIDVPFDDYLLGKETISFPAMYCACYDLKGNRIHKYTDQDNYKEDIRHIVCIKEWQMDKYSKNRMQEGKKIKDFYEVEFYLTDLINYWGESEIANEKETI